ncbi:MAG: PDZ domain-containing protein [Elusimicrobia bacterium]|nr:PDZ domain-containing protein [Elusimicrobiota bacterium]
MKPVRNRRISLFRKLPDFASVVEAAENPLPNNKLKGVKNKDGEFIVVSPGHAAKMSPEQQGIIGITLGLKDSDLIAGSVFPGGPADKAGMKPGDKILAIDARKTHGISVSLAQDNIGGKPGTLVVLKVRRGKRLLKFPLIREPRTEVDPKLIELQQRPRKTIIKEVRQDLFKDGVCPPIHNGCNFLDLSDKVCYYSCPNKTP